MEKILLNAKAVKKNKSLKKLGKLAKKYYGKSEKPVIGSKLCKVVDVTNVRCIKDVIHNHSQNSCLPTNREELLKLVSDAKLVGMSGSGFPVEEKLKTFINANATEKILIVNAVECEPTLVHDEWLVNNKYEEICRGIKILKTCLGIEKCILATKLPDINSTDEVEVHKVPACYPMGAEHILIKQLMGREILKNEIPTEKGILVMNVQTVYQLYHACIGNILNGKYITLVNIDKGEAVVSYIEYGTDIKTTLIKQFGECGEFYAGVGILYAHPLKEGEIFEQKTSFAGVGHAIEDYSHDKCKRCGRCSIACPMGVQVKKIVTRREKDPQADISDLGAERCLHCNTCHYVCAAHKNISELMEE